MKAMFCTILTCLSFIFISLSYGSDSAIDPHKQTKLGKYITAEEAFKKHNSDPDKFPILDVRTTEEFVYIGHPDKAINIPITCSTGKLDVKSKKLILKENPNFLEAVKSHFILDQTILVICRSGNRSADAVNILADHGFTLAYNVIDGFEGDVLKEPDNPDNGKRIKNGWKNHKLPWTYDIIPSMIVSAITEQVVKQESKAMAESETQVSSDIVYIMHCQ